MCSQSLRCVRWIDNPAECDHIQHACSVSCYHPDVDSVDCISSDHLGTLSPSTQQPYKGIKTNRRLHDTQHVYLHEDMCVVGSWAMSLSGCVAVLRVSNRSVQQAQTVLPRTRPMKPRQSGRTISIRSAKQYRSFHMPALVTPCNEAGCCCDAALSQAHYRSTVSIIVSSCRGINVTSNVRAPAHRRTTV